MSEARSMTNNGQTDAHAPRQGALPNTPGMVSLIRDYATEYDFDPEQHRADLLWVKIVLRRIVADQADHARCVWQRALARGVRIGLAVVCHRAGLTHFILRFPNVP